mmetsp:Transcript_28703/g.71986  ORF Transcript_28703/g.71986 Transcript_28703/m.71986 type:complete len:376 (-) Transcript_28703:56-1183(-)
MEHTVAIGSLVGDIAVLLILFLLRVLFIFLNIVLILAILLLLLLLSLLLVLLLFRLFLHLNLVPLRNLPLFFTHTIAGRHDILLFLFLLFVHGHVIVRFGCITPPLALFLVVLFLVLLFFLSISATQHPTAILPVIRARCLHHLPLALLLFLLFLLLLLVPSCLAERGHARRGRCGILLAGVTLARLCLNLASLLRLTSHHGPPLSCRLGRPGQGLGQLDAGAAHALPPSVCPLLQLGVKLLVQLLVDGLVQRRAQSEVLAHGMGIGLGHVEGVQQVPQDSVLEGGTAHLDIQLDLHQVLPPLGDDVCRERCVLYLLQTGVDGVLHDALVLGAQADLARQPLRAQLRVGTGVVDAPEELLADNGVVFLCADVHGQ